MTVFPCNGEGYEVFPGAPSWLLLTPTLSEATGRGFLKEKMLTICFHKKYILKNPELVVVLGGQSYFISSVIVQKRKLHWPYKV